MDPRLVDYIKRNLAKGIPREKIRENLLSRGWLSKNIDEAFNLATQKVSPGHSQSPKKSNGPLRPWVIPLFIILALIIGGVLIYLLLTQNKTLDEANIPSNTQSNMSQQLVSSIAVSDINGLLERSTLNLDLDGEDVRLVIEPKNSAGDIVSVNCSLNPSTSGEKIVDIVSSTNSGRRVELKPLIAGSKIVTIKCGTKTISLRIAVSESSSSSSNNNINATVNSTNTFPTWSNNRTNSTLNGTTIKHSVLLNDDIALSGYIFSFDNGNGTFLNDSWIRVSGRSSWSNTSKLINSTYGSIIRWIIYVNDSSNKKNVTNTFSYTAGINNSIINTNVVTISLPSVSATWGNWIAANIPNDLTRALPLGTQQVFITFVTDKSARCSWSVDANANFNSMTPFSYSSTSVYDLIHFNSPTDYVINLSNGQLNSKGGKNYAYYVNCKNQTGSTNPTNFQIRFIVGPFDNSTTNTNNTNSTNTTGIGGGCVWYTTPDGCGVQRCTGNSPQGPPPTSCKEIWEPIYLSCQASSYPSGDMSCDLFKYLVSKGAYQNTYSSYFAYLRDRQEEEQLPGDEWYRGMCILASGGGVTYASYWNSLKDQCIGYYGPNLNASSQSSCAPGELTIKSPQDGAIITDNDQNGGFDIVVDFPATGRYQILVDVPGVGIYGTDGGINNRINSQIPVTFRNGSIGGSTTYHVTGWRLSDYNDNVLYTCDAGTITITRGIPQWCADFLGKPAPTPFTQECSVNFVGQSDPNNPYTQGEWYQWLQENHPDISNFIGFNFAPLQNSCAEAAAHASNAFDCYAASISYEPGSIKWWASLESWVSGPEGQSSWDELEYCTCQQAGYI